MEQPEKTENKWVIGSYDVAKEIFVRNNRGRRLRKAYSYPPSRSIIKSDLSIIKNSQLYYVNQCADKTDLKQDVNTQQEQELQFSRIAKNCKSIVQEFEKITIKEPDECIVGGGDKSDKMDTPVSN